MNKALLPLLFLLIGLISACTFVDKIRDGDTAYDRKQYAVAIPMLKKEYDKTKSRVEKGKKAFLMGECYRNTNQIASSITWYKTAYDNSYGVDALKGYAYGLKETEQYAEAKQAFKTLGIEIGSPYEYRREILACEKAIAWKKGQKETGYTVASLPFNGSSSDYSPTLYSDGKLVFSSDRSASEGEEAYAWTGSNFSDLFLADLKSNTVEPFSEQINTNNNEGSVAFNNDYSLMIFTRCFNEDKYADNFCQLMMSERDGAGWSNPVALNFVRERINYMHPSLSADGSFLFFCSDNPEGWGGYDIYVSERTPDGWDEPQMLSRSINTIGNDRFPTIEADTLYFSSDYHQGMGGLDIFRSYRTGPKQWTVAQNLKAPINSGSDDFGLVINRNLKGQEGVLQQGYFSSSRNSGSGGDDIYRFEKRVPPPVVEIDTIEEPVEIVYKLILEGYVLEKIYEQANNPNSKILGRKPLPGASVNINTGKKGEQIKVDGNGFFSIEMDENTDYDLLASLEGYLNNSDRFSTHGIARDPAEPVRKFELEIVLDKIYKNQEIRLENIYYDFNESFIRQDAKPTLNSLAKTLSQNPDIRIELNSHTDCRGNPNYNANLSQRRAQAAVDYLISLGISSERLGARGYGESLLAIDCGCSRCTEDEHQANRRTTFKIVE